LFDVGDNSIAASLGNARNADDGASPASLDLAGGTTAIPRGGISVIALFGAADLSIPATDGGDAGLVGDGANIVGFDRALGTAPIAALFISVVASFAKAKA